MPRYNQQPDKNQALIDCAAQALGAEWIPISKFPGAGADRIYLYQGRMFVVEIKNPERYWVYEPSEVRLQELCKRQGIEYHTVETPEQLVEILRAP